ncbi:lysophospholipid acyltransferase family protein [Chloroflexota bacterium]
MSWFYYFGRFVIRVTLFLFTSTHVTGKNNLPKNGRLLVVANHLSLADPPLLGACLTRKAVFMAKEELFRSWLTRYFIRGFGAFPVHRGKLDRKAIRRAEQVLADNFVLVMFPEATRSSNARLKEAYSGSTMIAMRSNTPILPVGITGTEKVTGLKWLLQRPRLTVNIGHPFRLPEVKGKASRTQLNEHTTLMMDHIAELLPEQYHGFYGEHNETKN